MHGSGTPCYHYSNYEYALELLAEKEGGLGIVVVARAALVSGAEIEVNGGVEIVLGVKVEPVETGTAGVGFGSRHEVIYAYGQIAEIVARLREKNFAEVEMISVPVPHSHHFHEEMDAEEREVLAHWEWVQSELQETDDL
jgi:hypothetical protein